MCIIHPQDSAISHVVSSSLLDLNYNKNNSDNDNNDNDKISDNNNNNNKNSFKNNNTNNIIINNSSNFSNRNINFFNNSGNRIIDNDDSSDTNTNNNNNNDNNWSRNQTLWIHPTVNENTEHAFSLDPNKRPKKEDIERWNFDKERLQEKIQSRKMLDKMIRSMGRLKNATKWGSGSLCVVACSVLIICLLWFFSIIYIFFL